VTFKTEWNISNIIEIVIFALAMYRMHMANVQKLTKIETRLEMLYDWARERWKKGGGD
jgi:nicotinamide riboside transporter PnuC